MTEHASLSRYREFLIETSLWFDRVLADQRERMRCREGCRLCCYGLFDVSLPDALVLTAALEQLPGIVRSQCLCRAAEVQAAIARNAPELECPFILTEASEERIDEIVELAASPRCPLLDGDGRCIVYEHRPLACRIEGAPMVDARDGLFGDWCELNFTEGVPPGPSSVLARDYYESQRVEEICTRALSPGALGRVWSRATTFIPSLVVTFDAFWLPALNRLRGTAEPDSEGPPRERTVQVEHL